MSDDSMQLDAKNLSLAWSAVLDAVSNSEDSDPHTNAALRQSRPLTIKDNTLLLAVPNEYTRGIIQDRALAGILKHLHKIVSENIEVSFVVDPMLAGTPLAVNQAEQPDTVPAPAVEIQELQPTAPPPAVGVAKIDPTTFLNPAHTFESFVVGDSNSFSAAAATAVAEAPGLTYNPLFIYGDSGLGKTHLLHAIGNYALTLFPDLKVRYISSEEFTNDFINSIESKSMEDFKRRYRSIDILLIDDIQFLGEKESTVEEFFHTFNTLENANKQIVITSDVPPKNLRGFEHRITSRFQSGLIADIQPPALETRIAILRSRSKAENLELPYDVLEYIASRISSNIRELEGAFIRVTAYANLANQTITKPLAEIALKDYITDSDSQDISAALIISETAKYFGQTVEEICGPDRSQRIAEGRQIAMYLCRELTDLSLPKIGQEFGGRDHTTVMHGNKKISTLMKENHEIFDKVQELTNRIRQAVKEN